MMKKLNKNVLEYFVSLLEKQEKVSGKFVVVSKKTREDYTYKITGKKSGDAYFIDVHIEIGYNEYRKVGYWFDGKANMLGHIHGNENFSIGQKQATQGAVWFLKYMMKKDFDFILSKSNILHTGTCLKCGRELTDAESIEYGMGPTCRGFDVLRNREN